MTARAWSRSPRSARTNSARQPARSRSAETALPRAMLRPQIAMPAAPRAANRRAIASPIPCVPPVTTAILLLSSAPCRCASTMSNPRTVRPYSGEAESQYGCPLHFRPVICAQGFARMQGEIETMRVGLLGAGRIGRIHAGNIAAHRRAKLVVVADPDIASAQAVAGATGAAVETADAILAAPDIDAIFICTPTDMHAQLIEGAVRANKAVFCEKPIDLDAARIRACLDVVRNAGARLMVGFNRRFDPSFATIRRRLAAGEIGAVELVTILSRDPAPPPTSYIARSGGLFRDMMIHDFDMARFLLGEEPVEVHAVASCLIDPQIGAAGDVDTAAVLLKTSSGKIAQISNSRRATYGYDQRIEVHGSVGLLAAGNQHATTVTRADAQGYQGEPALPFFLERYAQAYRREIDAFVASILEGAPITPSGGDGLKAQLLADAATQATQSGHAVRVKL